MKDIKDMLVNGDKTPDELREILEKEIAAAQKEIGEKCKEIDLESVRKHLVVVAMEYLKALKVIDSIEVEFADTLVEALKESEPEIKKYAKILKILLEDEIKETKSKEFKPKSLSMFDKDEGSASFTATVNPKALESIFKSTKVSDEDLDKKMDELVAKIMKDIRK